MSPLASGYPANLGAVQGVGVGKYSVLWWRGSSQTAQLFFMVADGGGDGVKSGAQVCDFGAEPGQGVCFPAAGTVLFDEGSQVWVAVKGGSSEPSSHGDLFEGDRLAIENECGAGVFDLLSAALVGGHPVWT